MLKVVAHYAQLVSFHLSLAVQCVMQNWIPGWFDCSWKLTQITKENHRNESWEISGKPQKSVLLFCWSPEKYYEGHFLFFITCLELFRVLFFFTKKSRVRSSSFLWQKQPPEVFSKKSVLRNFAKFTEKHLYQSPFF